MRVFLILAAATLFLGEAHAQTQLVLLKKQNVLLRLYPGDEFIYKLKNSNRIRRSYINNLFDNAVLAHNDTVPFHTIDRIYFKRTTRGNIIGGALVFGGAALFLIDQLNNSVIRGNDFTLDNGVSTASVSAIAVGLPLLLIKKKSQKIGYRSRLITAKKGSSFYLPDPKGFTSPYLDN